MSHRTKTICLLSIALLMSSCSTSLNAPNKIEALIREYEKGLPNISIREEIGEIWARGLYYVKLDNDSTLYLFHKEKEKELKKENHQSSSTILHEETEETGDKKTIALEKGIAFMWKYDLLEFRKNDDLCLMKFIVKDLWKRDEFGFRIKYVYRLYQTEQEEIIEALAEQGFQSIKPTWYLLIKPMPDHQEIEKRLFGLKLDI